MKGRIVSRVATKFLVAADNKVITCVVRKNLTPLAIGDWVNWQLISDQQGVINAINPRKNLITRPNPFNRTDKTIVANIDLLFVVVSPRPKIDFLLLDEYMVLANYYQVIPIIVYHKNDIKPLGNQLTDYQKIGFKIIETSIKITNGIDCLTDSLAGKTGVFVGQSGVGKSSLINTLLPDKNLKTGRLSDISKGRHTTSHSTLYFLKNGGEIIDTPGIREFGLWKLNKSDIHKGFSEIYQHSTECQFNNCQHLKEPKCAIKNAVENGDIAKNRYDNYKKLITKR